MAVVFILTLSGYTLGVLLFPGVLWAIGVPPNPVVLVAAVVNVCMVAFVNGVLYLGRRRYLSGVT